MESVHLKSQSPLPDVTDFNDLQLWVVSHWKVLRPWGWGAGRQAREWVAPGLGVDVTCGLRPEGSAALGLCGSRYVLWGSAEAARAVGVLQQLGARQVAVVAGASDVTHSARRRGRRGGLWVAWASCRNT